MTKEDLQLVVEDLKEQKNVSRDQLQKICKSFRNIPTNVFLSWAPRIGKTRATLSMLDPYERVLFISNTTLIRDNWKDKISSWEFPIRFKSICYQSAHKVLNEYDVIVIDEVDTSLTEGVYEILKHFTPKRWVFLTGTTTYRTSILISKLCDKNLFTWTIDTQQAIDWGILPKPEIILFGINLQDDKTKRNQVFQIGKDKKKKTRVVKWGDHFQYLKSRKENLAIQVTEKEWIEMIEYDINRWKQLQADNNRFDYLNMLQRDRTTEEKDEMKELIFKLNKFNAPPLVIGNNINSLGGLRKKFFALRKNRFIKKLIKQFNLENERVLIFANSIPQAEWIDEETAVHSGKDSAHLLKEFNEGRINKLVCVGMLDRGVDVVNVNTSIMIQVSGSEAKNKQQSSRNMLDLSPRLIIIYYMNTQDQVYVDRFVSQFDLSYIKRISPYE